MTTMNQIEQYKFYTVVLGVKVWSTGAAARRPLCVLYFLAPTKLFVAKIIKAINVYTVTKAATYEINWEKN